jgi:hypothetical protein
MRASFFPRFLLRLNALQHSSALPLTVLAASTEGADRASSQTLHL